MLIRESQLIVPIQVTVASIFPPVYMRQEKDFKLEAIIDTGATHTSIREDIPLRLGLVPMGTILVQTPAGVLRSNQYMLRMILFDEIEFDNCRVTAMPMEQPTMCLIGMDILSNCRLICDGPNKTFSLELAVNRN